MHCNETISAIHSNCRGDFAVVEFGLILDQICPWRAYSKYVFGEPDNYKQRHISVSAQKLWLQNRRWKKRYWIICQMSLFFLPSVRRVVTLAGGDSPLELRALTVTSQLAQSSTRQLLSLALTLVMTLKLEMLSSYPRIFPLETETFISWNQRNKKSITSVFLMTGGCRPDKGNDYTSLGFRCRSKSTSQQDEYVRHIISVQLLSFL